MSYDELWQHAQRIEELALRSALDDQGIALVDGVYISVQDRNPVPADVVAFIRQDFEGLARMFEPFLDLPDPATLDAMHAELSNAYRALASAPLGFTEPVHGQEVRANAEMGKMETVKQTMFEWQGFAAKHFYAQFVEPWDAVTANQFGLVATLAGAIAAEKALWQECRNNVDELAHRAIEAFESMGGGNGVAYQVLLLTVASSVFSVAATMATGGGGVLAFTVAGATAQVTATAADKFSKEEPPKVLFDAPTPRTLVDQIEQALYRLMFVVLQKEQEIADAMTTMGATVTAYRADFVSPRPALADQSRRTILTPQGLDYNA